MCTEKFINPFTDFGFKRLFGSASDSTAIISFLNSLFGHEDPIVEITYRDTEHFGLSSADRLAIYDIYCTTSSGSHFIVEMQNGYQHYFLDRSVYYSSFPMQEAAKKGDWNYCLPPIYMVAFLNFKMDRFLESPRYKHEIRLCDTATHEVVYKKLTFVFLEMPKFDKQRDELETYFDKWMYIIKNLNHMNEMPHDMMDETFRKFFERARIAAFSPEELEAYEESLKHMRDYHNTLVSAEEKGIEQGIEIGKSQGIEIGKSQGIEIGKSQGIMQVAANLKRQGLSSETIAAATGLSTEVVDAIEID